MVTKSEWLASRCAGVFAQPDPDGEDIHAVLRRVTAAQPKIFLLGHEGYYRHADIATLIRALGDAINPSTEDTGEWTPDPTKA